MLPEELNKRFDYVRPVGEKSAKHEEVRALVKQFAKMINNLLPLETREKALAITKIEEAQMWAHADIARNQ
jgi:hypothetical protein